MGLPASVHDTRRALHSELIECEKQRPEFQEDTHFISTPNYLQRKDDKIPWIANSSCLSTARIEGEVWFQYYLKRYVDKLQQMKQHHVHMVNPITNEKEPLTSCRRKDNPKLFKTCFPKTTSLVERVVEEEPEEEEEEEEEPERMLFLYAVFVCTS